MPSNSEKKNNNLLDEAVLAYKQGDLIKARYLAIRSILYDPGKDSGWVLLAAVSPPERAIYFLNKALQINPDNIHAQQGINWANQKVKIQPFPPSQTSSSPHVDQKKKAIRTWVIIYTKRILVSVLILVAIAFLTLLSLQLARMGQQRIPFNFSETFQAVFGQLQDYLINHPETYIWNKESIASFQLVFGFFINSAGLLLLSLFVALGLGGILGIGAARVKNRNLAPAVIGFSLFGISIPSFLLAMLLWVLNFRFYRWIGLKSAILPPTGFGWDLHLIMPVLVLAARPLAQIAQITYVTSSEVLREDYIRTAQAKGLRRGLITSRHVYRNILIPVLTTLGTSLRFSLASLPIVESFFLWPGVGLSILEAINLNMPFLVTDLIVVLGLFFLIVNFALDFLYPLIDPRIRTQRTTDVEISQTENMMLGSFREMLIGLWEDLKAWVRMKRNKKSQLPGEKKITQQSKVEEAPAFDKISATRILFRNIPLIIGTLLTLGFIGLSLFGENLAKHNPSETNSMLIIDDQIQTPPFKPSDIFPWGSDLVGRDIQALVLAGASQTLSLALIATIARVFFGAVLGIVAGWWSQSWLDRTIQGISSVWIAFPETIFAMLIILALGIQRGRIVFITALCLVGWTEITQFVRSEVIGQKPKPHIEAVRSIGARPRQILIRHVFPHLIPSILVLFALQMGGILMLLAELGFLNIFLGGGFRANIAEGAGMVPIIFYFSDIPEWGALLANIRDWWRSYPWLAWYPGIFFFLAIFTFNIWGEGLRRVIQETRINLNRLFNRYTFGMALIGVLGLVVVMRTTSPLNQYLEQAQRFDTENALAHINELSSQEYLGRQSGFSGSRNAAEYIAAQMEEIGLFTGASNDEFLQTYIQTYPQLDSIPSLNVSGPSAESFPELKYRQDFAEFVHLGPGFGVGNGKLTVAFLNPATREVYEQKAYREIDQSLTDKIVMIREEDVTRIRLDEVAGLVIVIEDEDILRKRLLYPSVFWRGTGFPILQISTSAASNLLSTCDTNFDQITRMAESANIDEISTIECKTIVSAKVPGHYSGESTSEHYNVLGYIPGTGANQPGQGGALSADQQVVIVSAYYDGLGIDPVTGEHYPGANDNASGVALMLEIARALKEGPYAPEKTVLFIAWAPGERQKGLSIVNITEATTAFNNSYLEAVLEINGVGAGNGDALSLNQGSSFRLVNLFKNAAQRTNTKITTRGRSPHTEFPIITGFGERTALTALISWDGSDITAHTLEDNVSQINPEYITKSGQTVLLVTTMIAREPDY